MKKIIAILLMITLCLGLAGCSTNGDSTEVKELHGEFDIDYIVDEEIIHNEEEVEVSNSAIEYEMTPAMEFWLEHIPGEYIGFHEREDDELYEITMNADGTCTFDDNEYTWDFLIGTNGAPTCDEDGVVVSILDDNTTVFAFSIGLAPCGFIDARICIPNEFGGIIDSLSGIYLNTTGLDVIELTSDNWQDYFEYVEDFRIQYRSSDYVTAEVAPRYQLKEEYGFPIHYYSDLTIEYIGQGVRQKITVDLENETYEWGDVTETFVSDEPAEDEIYPMFDDNNNLIYYGYSLYTSAVIENFPEEEVLWKHFEITGIYGTLYCVPTE